jgi:hypothetical protein
VPCQVQSSTQRGACLTRLLLLMSNPLAAVAPRPDAKPIEFAIPHRRPPLSICGQLLHSLPQRKSDRLAALALATKYLIDSARRYILLGLATPRKRQIELPHIVRIGTSIASRGSQQTSEFFLNVGETRPASRQIRGEKHGSCKHRN